MHHLDPEIARDGKKKPLMLDAVDRISELQEVGWTVVVSKMRPEHCGGFLR